MNSTIGTSFDAPVSLSTDADTDTHENAMYHPHHLFSVRKMMTPSSTRITMASMVTPPTGGGMPNKALDSAMEYYYASDDDDEDEDDSIATPFPPPAPKRCRSGSPTGAMDVRFFRDDFHDSFGLLPFSTPSMDVDDDDDDDDDGGECGDRFLEESGCEPLPLLSSISTDLSDLLHQYLPKTKLELYHGPQEDEMHMDDSNANAYNANANDHIPYTPHGSQQQQLQTPSKRNLLPDFELCNNTADGIEANHPFPFVVADHHIKASKPNPAPSSMMMMIRASNTKPKPTPVLHTSKPKTKPKRKAGVVSSLKQHAAAAAAQPPKRRKQLPSLKQQHTATITPRLFARAPHNTTRISSVLLPATPRTAKLLALRIKLQKDVAELTVRTVLDANTRIIEKTWEHNYSKLAAFYKTHGHSSVLRSDPDKQLSGWVKRQRNNLKDRKLTDVQIDRLNALSFVWNRLEGAWYDKYEKLWAFAGHNQTCEVPTKYDRSLAEWTQRQRREHRNGATTMTAERRQKLTALPHWSWKSKAWTSRKSRGGKCAVVAVAATAATKQQARATTGEQAFGCHHQHRFQRNANGGAAAAAVAVFPNETKYSF